MTDYTVHFSYYNEEEGRFAESAYRVKADDQFEARRKAWENFDKVFSAVAGASIKNNKKVALQHRRAKQERHL